jgi:hypothetical protein
MSTILPLLIAFLLHIISFRHSVHKIDNMKQFTQLTYHIHFSVHVPVSAMISLYEFAWHMVWKSCH